MSTSIPPKKFISVDLEGFTHKGDQNIYLVGRGDKEPLVSDKKPLTFTQMLNYLTEDTSKDIYVAYYFSYDFTMLIKAYLAEFKDENAKLRNAKKLLDYVRTMGESTDQDYLGLPKVFLQHPSKPELSIMITYVPGKIFGIAQRLHNKTLSSIVIYDVSSFFATSFIKALDAWQISYPIELAQGKEDRSKFTLSFWQQNQSQVIHYNQLELSLLSELMSKFRDVVHEQRIFPKLWIGPGALASDLLDRKYDKLSVSDKKLEFARRTMVGGWFEIMYRGECKNIYQYDINSAYPAALSTLPEIREDNTILTSSKRDIKKYLQDDSFIFVAFKGSVKFEDGTEVPALPARQKNMSIYNPLEITSGYHQGEPFKASLQKGMIESYNIDQALFIYDDMTRPFEWIDTFYQRRIDLGKDLQGYPIKLALNSLYGKFAQSLGRPKFAHPIYATLITGLTRAKIINAIPSNQTSIIMIATDAVFSQVELDLPISKALGEWSVDKYEKLLIIQPGIYFGIRNGEFVKSRTRGLASDAFKKMTYNDIVEHYQINNGLKISRNVFYSWRSAVARGKLEDVGKWSFEPQVVKAGGDKRIWIGDYGYPKPTSDHLPYTKPIGLDLILSNAFDYEVEAVENWNVDNG